MTRERRLGRGLEVLLGRLPGQPAPAAAPDPASASDPTPPPDQQTPGPAADESDGAMTLPLYPPSEDAMAGPDPPAAAAPLPGPQRIDVDRIDGNPAQPRQDFDPAETRRLADSLHAHGLLQPVVVRKVDDRYELIAGERRLRAAREAGWTDVPANVIQADDRTAAELAIVENLQRRDLNPLEKAASFQRYLEQYGCTQEELAKRLEMDRSTIANLVRLLELPEPVQETIRAGRITQGHARALLPLGEEREQIEFCERIRREGLSVRQTEALVQESIVAADAEPLSAIAADGVSTRPRRPQSEHVAALEEELRLALGTKVKITHTSRGRGKLVIHFRSHEEFERLRHHLSDPAQPEPQSRAG